MATGNGTESPGFKLPQELVLLALNPDSGRFRGQYLGYGIAGAMLMELTLLDRITLQGKKAILVSNAPTGDKALDEVIRKLDASKKNRTLKRWVEKIGGGTKLAHTIAGTLVEQGVLRTERRKFLGLIPYTIYPALQSSARDQIVQRVRAGLLNDGAPDVRVATLASIAQPTGLLRQLFDRQERMDVRKKIRRLKKDDEYAKAVGETIAGVQAAVMAAVAASTIAASSSSSS